jgi:LPS-assembly lipoprotein
MWWHKHAAAGHLARLAMVFAAASLTAGCFEPLYGNRPAVGTDNVHDKLAAVELAPAPKLPSASGAASPSGNTADRLSVAMRNALQYDLNGGAGAVGATHRLVVSVGATGVSFIINILTGLPTAQISGVTASYQLVEIATGKIVLKDTAHSDVDYDIAGPQQRFTVQRAELEAEDRAIKIVAEAIRNRLASYFVAGT